MVEENNKDPKIILNNTENEKFREKNKKIAPLVNKIRKENLKNFQKALKKFINIEKFTFNHPLLFLHFFFKGIQEVNELLTKNNKGFLLDFNNDVHYFF